MLLPRLRSLNMLILAGFALVSLPLIFAILLTSRYVDGITRESSIILVESVQATRNNQILLENINSLERNARQYHIVGNPELLEIYAGRHQKLLNVLADLETSLPGPKDEIYKIENSALSLLQTLQNHPFDSPEITNALSEFSMLEKDAQIIKDNISRNTDSMLTDLQMQARTFENFIYWQAVILITLALGLSGLFAILIARPVRQLSKAILQLGIGDMNKPISVKGPLDLEALGQRLDWLRIRLHELEQEKNKFLSHVSHELKTPLANIREGSELLKDGSVGILSKDQYEVVDILQTNSLLLQSNIENLLNFSVWQDMKARLRYNQCRLRDIVKRVLKQHHLSIKRLSQKINISISSDLELYADRDKLQIALDNLVSNAVKFSPAGSSIHITADQDSDFINIHIIDNGPGIPENEREHIFEAFYQGQQAQHSHVSGTGIGLAVVRECVLAHNGNIKLLDQPDKGAHFVIQLPIQPR